MKKQVLFTILAMLVSVSAFSHDIEVKNADGVTIYYDYMNVYTELAVTYRGSKYNEYSNEYQGNVVIPASVSYSGKTYPVTSIGRGAFEGCTGLKNLAIHNNRPPVAESKITSQEVYDNCVLYVPEGSENAYYVADVWKYFKNIQTIVAVEKVPQDVNGDGIVDTQDVLEIYQYIQEH